MGLFSKQEETKKEPAKKAAKVKAGKKAASMKELYKEGEEKKTVGEKVDEKKKIRKSNVAYKALIKPLITEKAANLGTVNKYVFMAAEKANKIEIAKAIEEVYGVKPVAVNIIKMMGKFVRSGRTAGKRKDWKKAIITLPKGKSIKVYEGV